MSASTSSSAWPVDRSTGPATLPTGYLTRGGRMVEPHFACTFDLLRTVPSADDPAVSVADDIMAFNRMVPGSSTCRLVRGGRPAEDRHDLGLAARDVVDINCLLLSPERAARVLMGGGAWPS